MKLSALLSLLPFLALSACATRVYEDGKPVLATYSNATSLEYHSPKGTYLRIEGMDNSTPTRVGLDGITKAGVSIGTAIATHGASRLIPTK